MKLIFKSLLLFCLISTLFGCFRDASKKASKELYDNRMDFNFSNCKEVKYGNVRFKLPNKFVKEAYINIHTNGKNALTYGIENLFLYFVISEISKNEAANIRYLTNESNLHQAIQRDATYKRQISINSQTAKCSQVRTLNYKYNFLYQAVTVPYTCEYKWDSNNTSTYYIASFSKNNRYFVIQFTGRGENLRYFLDDFKHILKTFN